MSLFRSNLRKQIRKLPEILKSVKIIHWYFFLLFIIIHLCPSSRNLGPAALAFLELVEDLLLALQQRVRLAYERPGESKPALHVFFMCKEKEKHM